MTKQVVDDMRYFEQLRKIAERCDTGDRFRPSSLSSGYFKSYDSLDESQQRLERLRLARRGVLAKSDLLTLALEVGNAANLLYSKLQELQAYDADDLTHIMQSHGLPDDDEELDVGHSFTSAEWQGLFDDLPAAVKMTELITEMVWIPVVENLEEAKELTPSVRSFMIDRPNPAPSPKAESVEESDESDEDDDPRQPLADLVQRGRAFVLEASHAEKQFRDEVLTSQAAGRPSMIPLEHCDWMADTLSALAVTVDHLVGSVDALLPPASYRSAETTTATPVDGTKAA